MLDDGEMRNSKSTWDRWLELSFLNVESLVSAVHQATLNISPGVCTHRPSLLPIESSAKAREWLLMRLRTRLNSIFERKKKS